MGKLDETTMRAYLSKSISSLNRNKINGIVAEIDFRNYLVSLGFGDRISAGGWIARNDGAGTFGHDTSVFFPEIISINQEYPVSRNLPNPTLGLHTICATFHQLGIRSYFCAPTIALDNNPSSIVWHSIHLGLPTQQQYQPFPANMNGYRLRSRNFNFLRYNTNVSNIPSISVGDQFSKEQIRVAFQNAMMSEMSDIDGILWGQQYTYPLEIKEKTAAQSNQMGDFFGLDLGPFVKLAFYASKRGNLHSIFVVREIDNPESRNLVNWWFIEFDHLAQYASWVPSGGGTNMQGGQSTVVRIPKAEFRELNQHALAQL